MRNDGADDALVAEVRSVMAAVFQRDLPEGPVAVAAIEEWDSLKHVELVMELEAEFAVEIAPDEIARLYTDSQAIVDFLKAARQ